MKDLRIIFALLLSTMIACNSSTKQKKEEKILANKNIPKVVTADIEAGIKANIAKMVEEGDDDEDVE